MDRSRSFHRLFLPVDRIIEEISERWLIEVTWGTFTRIVSRTLGMLEISRVVDNGLFCWGAGSWLAVGIWLLGSMG